MRNLLCVVIYLSVLNLNAQGTPPKTPPVLSNFRIENSQPSRVYFDSSKGLKGSSTRGFMVSGKKINAIKINTGQTKGHYLTVSTSFTFWDNNTIRYEGGGNLQDSKSNPLGEFTLEYIVNDIKEPDSRSNTYYVSASGNDKNKGTSESSAWRTISKAASSAKSGSTVWIKAGDYGSENVVVKHSGKVNDPIKFLGYRTTPGDKPSLVRTQTTNFSASQMPYIHSGSKSGSGFSTGTKDYIIVRNIQVEGYANTIDIANSSYCILDNVYAKGGKTNINDFPYFKSVQNRVINSYTANASHNGVYMTGARHLIDNVYASSKGTPDMDYYLVIVGGNVGIGEHIIRNCEVVRDLNDTHPGHGISFKAQGRNVEYSLVEKSTITNVGMSLEARHSGSKNNVYKDLYISNQGSKSGTGIQITSAVNSIFERIHVSNKSFAIKFLGSTEDPYALDAGNGNLIRNCLFTNNTISIKIIEDLDRQNRIPKNNIIANSIFDNSTSMYSIEANEKGKNNNFVNCIINNVKAEYYSNSNSSNFGYSYTDFYGKTGSYWSNKVRSGVGNISVILNLKTPRKVIID